MPARDLYHDAVKNALLKDGWTITDDPLFIKWGTKDMYVDLGAERLLAAQKDQQKIAVEIKSFAGASDMAELERALGQFLIYRGYLRLHEPERILYLAVPMFVRGTLFEEPLGKYLLSDYSLRLIYFDPKHEVLLQWVP